MQARAPLILLLLIVLVIGQGCSSAPKRSPRPSYSAPTSVKVQSGISKAQTAIAKAVTVHAKAATEKIVQLETLTAATPELHDLAAAAHSDIDSLTLELSTAQEALAAAETARAELQVRIETQTDQLNTATNDKNRALGLLDIEKKNADRARKQRNRLGLLTVGLLVWIFREPLLRLGGTLFKLARLAVGIPV